MTRERSLACNHDTGTVASQDCGHCFLIFHLTSASVRRDLRMETSLEHVAALFYDTTELLSLSDKEELSCQSLNRRMIRIVTLFQRHKKTCIALLKGLEQ